MNNMSITDGFSTLKIGTRGSPLALAQTEWVCARLRQINPDCPIEVVVIRTEGDEHIHAPLSEIGGQGVFTRAIEHALLDGRIDAAIHSLKDLPTDMPDGLCLGTVCEREDPRDALVARYVMRLDELPAGATVATGSARRRAQLLNRRPDLRIVDVRGNVGTRLEKYESEGWDAMVLAHAGLLRLGLENRAIYTFPPDEMLPAIGQGALGIQIRGDDTATARRIAPLDHPPTHLAVRAERAFLHALGGGCRMPVAALGSIIDDRLILDGLISTPDGRVILRSTRPGDPDRPEALGELLADDLFRSGAKKILEAI
jgi:hydroxymethylbilane synthase